VDVEEEDSGKGKCLNLLISLYNMTKSMNSLRIYFYNTPDLLQLLSAFGETLIILGTLFSKKFGIILVYILNVIKGFIMVYNNL